MIYAYNILTGYMAIRGCMFIHIPMFFAQLAFVRTPKNLGEGFEDLEESFNSWWHLALFMHFIMAMLHVGFFAIYVTSGDKDDTGYEDLSTATTLDTLLRVL